MNSQELDNNHSGKRLNLPEPDPDNITVLTRNLPNKPILPWHHYDSPWSDNDAENPEESEITSTDEPDEEIEDISKESDVPSAAENLKQLAQDELKDKSSQEEFPNLEKALIKEQLEASILEGEELDTESQVVELTINADDLDTESEAAELTREFDTESEVAELTREFDTESEVAELTTKSEELYTESGDMEQVEEKPTFPRDEFEEVLVVNYQDELLNEELLPSSDEESEMVDELKQLG